MRQRPNFDKWQAGCVAAQENREGRSLKPTAGYRILDSSAFIRGVNWQYGGLLWYAHALSPDAISPEIPSTPRIRRAVGTTGKVGTRWALNYEGDAEIYEKAGLRFQAHRYVSIQLPSHRSSRSHDAE